MPSIGGAAKATWNTTKRIARTLNEPGIAPNPEYLNMAIKASRKIVLSKAILAFIILLTLDDLAILRFPAYLIAAAVALYYVSFGALVMGRQMALRHHEESHSSYSAYVGNVERAGVMALIGALIIFVGWFIAFTVEVPPWVG